MSSTKGHVYICQFDNGMVKVGRSARNPESRIDSHVKRMSCTGAVMVDNYISPILHCHEDAEEELMEIISGNLTSDSKEWASGITKDQILAKAAPCIDDLASIHDWHERYLTVPFDNKDDLLVKFHEASRPFAKEIASQAMPDISKIEKNQTKAEMLLAMSVDRHFDRKHSLNDAAYEIFNLSNDPYSDLFYASYLVYTIDDFYMACIDEVGKCQKDG